MANETYKAFRDHIGFKQYILARILGLSETTFSALLRHELPEEVQNCLIQAIKCYVCGDKIDLSAWQQWIQKNGELKLRSNFRRREICRGLDEAEERRKIGGWDMLFADGPLRDDCKVFYKDSSILD